MQAEVELAGYMRNAGCVSAQERARGCNEEGGSETPDVGGEGNVKGLPVQDLASPGKAMQEASNSLPANEMWWRRRESNPHTTTPKARMDKDLQHHNSPCGLYAEQDRDNPLAALARKWDQLSPEVQAALRALAAALQHQEGPGKQTGAG